MDIENSKEKIFNKKELESEIKKDFKSNSIKSINIFSQTYSIYILSNLSNSLMLPEKSAFEKLCIYIEEREDDNNFNYLDLKIYDMFNKYGQNIFKFFNEDLADYLIVNIWSGLLLLDEKKQMKVENKKIVLKTFINLLYFREIGLIVALLNLYYGREKYQEDKILSALLHPKAHDFIRDDLECCFIRLVSYSRLENKKKFIKELNYFIGIISNVNKEIEEDEKRSFIEFYSIFYNTQSDDYSNIFKKSQKHEDKKRSKPESELNFKLLTFYLLEDYLKKNSLLNGHLQFDFYYNTFNYVYPLIKNNSRIDKLRINFENLRNQRFLIDYLNSCLQVDFDLSLTFYLSIINEVSYIKDLNEKMISLFVEYIIEFMKKPKTSQFFNALKLHNKDQGKSDINIENKNEPNFSNNYLIEKIILSDSRLLTNICLYLENECYEIKSHRKLKDYFGIKESLIQKEPTNEYKLDLKMSLNIFYLLHKIYSDMKDYHNAARLSLLYVEALDEIIKENLLSLEEMLRIYNEKNISLQNLIFSIKKIYNKNSSIYLLKLSKLNSTNPCKIKTKIK